MCVFVQSKRVNSFNHFDCVISLWLLNVKKNLEAAILTSEHTAFLATLSATTKEGSSVFFSYFSVYSLDSRDPRLFQVDLKRVCPAQRKKLGDLSAHPIFYLLVVSLDFDYFVRWILLLRISISAISKYIENHLSPVFF